jgi:C4-dicarboxylate-specific signal transduction histidine kinase
VINLVGNALDAIAGRAAPGPLGHESGAPVRRPAIEVQAGENLAGTEVWLRVRDNGPGIEPARLEQIWAPFHTTKANGTGLGLPITRKIVETHGGSIEVEVPPGGGTEFRVALPKAGLAGNGA